MAKSAVNERKLFEIPALLCCEQGNSAENKPGIIQIIYVLWISSSYILFFAYLANFISKSFSEF